MGIATYIDLPNNVLEQSNGLAIDIGGSSIKIAYRDKNKDKRVQGGEPPIAEGRDRVRLAMYSKDNLEQALKHLTDCADVRREGDTDTPLINATGLGSNEYGTEIASHLRINLQNFVEFDCFIKAFTTIAGTLCKDEAVDLPNAAGLAEGQTIVANMMATFAQIQDRMDTKVNIDQSGAQPETPAEVPTHEQRPLAKEADDLFPCLIMLLGSGYGFLKVFKDGTYQVLDVSSRGGKSFLGLGSLLTGAKTYEELTSLAEKGNDYEVNTYSQDIVDTTQADVYAATPRDIMAFSFGKATGKKLDNFKKEDLARALVVQHASDIADAAHLTAASSGSTNVFFAGSLGNGDIVRREITKLLFLRRIMPLTAKPVNFEFLKHGCYLGVIGALLQLPKV